MNWPNLFSQLLILVSTYQCSFCEEVSLKLRSITIPNERITKQNVLLIKSDNKDEYHFNDYELNLASNAYFSSTEVEITSVCNTSLSFSLPDANIIIQCEFAKMSDLQLFFIDIRKGCIIEHEVILIDRLFIYPINDQNIIPVATVGDYFYVKTVPMSEHEDVTFNLVRRYFDQNDYQVEEADLVFSLLGKAALTPKVENNYYGLCVEDFPNFIFILFLREPHMVNFKNAIANYLHPEMRCPLKWLSHANIKFMDTYDTILLPPKPYFNN